MSTLNLGQDMLALLDMPLPMIPPVSTGSPYDLRKDTLDRDQTDPDVFSRIPCDTHPSPQGDPCRTPPIRGVS